MQEKKYKKVLIYLGAILLIGLAGTVTILIVNKNKDKVELMVTDSNVIEQIELLEPVELMEPIEPAKQTEPIEDVLEVMGESLKNYSKIEPDVYISNDSTQIFVVSATKWKKYKNNASSRFKYPVRDVEFKKQMPYDKYKAYLPYDNNQFHEFKFVGIIQIFEYAVKIQEYKKGKGKYYEYLTEQRFWNCDWCNKTKYNDGRNVTNTVVIR